MNNVDRKITKRSPRAVPGQSRSLDPGGNFDERRKKNHMIVSPCKKTRRHGNQQDQRQFFRPLPSALCAVASNIPARQTRSRSAGSAANDRCGRTIAEKYFAVSASPGRRAGGFLPAYRVRNIDHKCPGQNRAEPAQLIEMTSRRRERSASDLLGKSTSTARAKIGKADAA